MIFLVTRKADMHLEYFIFLHVSDSWMDRFTQGFKANILCNTTHSFVLITTGFQRVGK